MTADNSALSQLSDKEYKRRIRAWEMYDWANSAFAATILAAVLPVYYSSVAGANLPSAAKATQYWSLTLSVSVFIVALLSPILGTVSDIMRGKKKFLSLFVGIGVVGTGLLFFVDTGDWLLASMFFIFGRIGFGAAIVFYDALLPHVAKPEDQDKVSTQGYALGYLGGGILLAVNIVMIQMMPGTSGARWSFVTVALWWALFSIPLFLYVPEPATASARLEKGESLVKRSFQQIWHTLKNIRNYNELFKFLIAFLIYNDGINIIISVAAIYGAELGFSSTELILAIMLVQFVGIPYSLIFGSLPSKQNARQKTYVAFVLFNIISLPIVAIIGRNILPKAITGTPSPPFETIGGSVGEGHYLIDEGTGYELDGSVEAVTISAEDVAQGCAWYAIWCDDIENAQTYIESNDPNFALDFAFNGQQVVFTYGTGPDFGIWDVYIDGEPASAAVCADDEACDAVQIDAYSPTVRYAVAQIITAKEEGQHVLTIQSSGEANPDSSGIKFSAYQTTVNPPLRDSNLLTIIGILLVVVVIGLLFAYFNGPRYFGTIANWLNTKNSIQLALVAYSIIAVWGFFLDSVIEFWFLAWMVAVVQGGSQALSRSLYAAMTPAKMSGEFFGFFSIMSKFASFLSPLVFVASVAIFNSSRQGVLSLIVFFLVGMYLLTKVDVEKGKAYAQARNAELE